MRDVVRPPEAEELSPTEGTSDGVAAPRASLRLMLVDDHAILRAGLRALIELESDITIVGEAGSCDEALYEAARCRPDIVLSDIGMPGRSGISLVADMRRLSANIAVILLTAHASKEYIHAALDARADGYVLKDSTRAELITAIRTVAKGESYLCKAVTETVLSGYLSRNGERTARNSPFRSVTVRERQVLSRIAAGHTNKTIAREMNLSVKTVEKHRANLMRKLDLHNAADIARFALNCGLISSTEETAAPVPV